MNWKNFLLIAGSIFGCSTLNSSVGFHRRVEQEGLDARISEVQVGGLKLVAEINQDSYVIDIEEPPTSLSVGDYNNDGYPDVRVQVKTDSGNECIFYTGPNSAYEIK